jgi:CBS-domain-containing membrane protein
MLFLPLHIRQASSLAFAIGFMVKLGLIHPPAGASALHYSTGLSRWYSFLFFMIGNVLCIIVATFINNLSPKRQYPSYWGIPGVDEEFFQSNRSRIAIRNRATGSTTHPLRNSLQKQQ